VNSNKPRFRWVDRQPDSLKKCLVLSDVRKTLKSSPKTPDETYARILLNIDAEHQSKAITALQRITYSCQPMSIEEVAEAVVIDPKAMPPFNPDNRLPDLRWLIEILSSLIVVSRRTSY
jgi:ankyrin repeat domain-containing protein 50